MIALIRADATLEIGTGHVMRCAALGMRLRDRGALVHLVCVGLPGRLANWLRDQGFGLTVLPAAEVTDWRADLAATKKVVEEIGAVDLLIVDHYRLELEWERGMRPHVRRILAIDDLADREHDCDLLLDQNLHDHAETRYGNLLPKSAIQFLGPRYALLRTEFDAPGLERVRAGHIRRLLVFFGGTDPGNQTAKVIDALRRLGKRAPASTFVLGPAYPDRQAIHQSVASLPNVTVLDVTDQMSRLMAEADLAIGTCGIAAWERCVLGLPSLVVVTAENQREDAEILHRLGALENLGEALDVSAEDWAKALERAIEQPDRMQAMGRSAQNVMLGREAAIAELDRVLIDSLAQK
jgi:UDP-2,4-diacetamido-2,4,6-trideoxy-beta-L-altropyranose hydrolase